MEQESEEKSKTREVESWTKGFPVETLAQLWTVNISILDTENGQLQENVNLFVAVRRVWQPATIALREMPLMPKDELAIL